MEKVEKGRRIVIAFIVIVILMDILTVVSLYLNYSTNGRIDLANGKLIQGTIRIILTGLLLLFMYKGYGWAKWVSVILFLLSGVGSLLLIIESLNISFFILGGVYLIIGIMLIASSNVNDFFKHQRGKL